MASFFRMKRTRLPISLLIALCLSLSIGMAAMAAASGDLVYDNYDRANLADFASSGAKAEWTGGDAGKSATIDGNALKLEYASKGWFGTGGGIDVTASKYLIIKIKGAAGGEGADFDLNYAVGSTVKTVGFAFADLKGPSGDKVPGITTDYQDIVIDLAANKIDSGIQALHFNFHEGKSGTIWIDQISFATKAPGGATKAAEPAKTDTSAAAPADNSAAPAAEANPATGDSSNVAMYAVLALLSGMALLTVGYKAVRARGN